MKTLLQKKIYAILQREINQRIKVSEYRYLALFTICYYNGRTE